MWACGRTAASVVAFIGALGGLIVFGGAEFRLPLLIGMFRSGALEPQPTAGSIVASIASRP
jgi:hypothetical protein